MPMPEVIRLRRRKGQAVFPLQQPRRAPVPQADPHADVAAVELEGPQQKGVSLRTVDDGQAALHPLVELPGRPDARGFPVARLHFVAKELEIALGVRIVNPCSRQAQVGSPLRPCSPPAVDYYSNTTTPHTK